MQSVEVLKRPVKVDINEIQNVWQGSTNDQDKTMSGTLSERTIDSIGDQSIRPIHLQVTRNKENEKQ